MTNDDRAWLAYLREADDDYAAAQLAQMLMWIDHGGWSPGYFAVAAHAEAMARRVHARQIAYNARIDARDRANAQALIYARGLAT